ncbi:DUF4265 domain-containing protein [Empedobacter brevis]|uniref:DUF4265 domain-containing protein n=1 Tax=Empedobacter brevis TaxID=247 RepID=A0AAJ1V8X5_9FLAO|nr:DUF4265 domain-containing protein [Empedobacter brevis]MDM1072410.1 DUF4265 domain-containing protein [Empedobacter brevis]
MTDQIHQKIVFEYFDEELNQNIVERLWAKPFNGNYILDNIPFHIYLYSCDDVVSVKEKNGELFIDRLIEPSGNSTVRLLLNSVEDLESIKKELNELGLESESSSEGKLLAVNIPKKIMYNAVRDYLINGEEEGRWQYEEASISENHQKDVNS